MNGRNPDSSGRWVEIPPLSFNNDVALGKIPLGYWILVATCLNELLDQSNSKVLFSLSFL